MHLYYCTAVCYQDGAATRAPEEPALEEVHRGSKQLGFLYALIRSLSAAAEVVSVRELLFVGVVSVLQMQRDQELLFRSSLAPITLQVAWR